MENLQKLSLIMGQVCYHHNEDREPCYDAISVTKVLEEILIDHVRKTKNIDLNTSVWIEKGD